MRPCLRCPRPQMKSPVGADVLPRAIPGIILPRDALELVGDQALGAPSRRQSCRGSIVHSQLQ